MSKLIIMKGLPACGKSTRAEQIIAEQGNAVRLNKDLMRTMLHFDKFTGINEGLTRDAVRSLAKMLLEKTNVIIDDTNLNPGTMQGWMDLAKEVGAKVEIIDMTDVQPEECVFRDSQREKAVGGTVIKNMALRYGLKSFPQGSVVLCDIDGTIADTTHRLHFVKDNGAPDFKKDWKGFFSQMHLDPVRKDVQKILIGHYNEMKTVIFVSARPETYLKETLDWLHKHNLSFAYTLIMRRANDKRPDTEVKADILKLHFPDTSVIAKVIDDRPSVIRMWRDMGLDVLDVGGGEEF